LKCPKCGSEINNSNECLTCGIKLDNYMKHPDEEVTENSQKEKSQTKRSRPIVSALIWAAIGFFGLFILGTWEILRSTSSTAAIGFIFLPVACFLVSLPFALFGFCSSYVIGHFREQKKDLSFGYVLSLCVSLFLLGAFVYWLGDGLIIYKVTNDVKNMEIEELQTFLNQSIFRKNKFVLNAILSRPDINTDMLYQIASIGSPELHERMGSLFPIMGENTMGLAVMRLVATHPNVDARSLIVLSKSTDEYVLGDVASNKKTPEEIITKLSEKGGYLIEWGLANNPNCPKEVLHKLSTSTDEYTRAGVAGNENTDKDDLVLLSEDPLSNVRSNVAGNKTTPQEVIEVLKNDPDEYVRNSASCRSRNYN
jgi:hypothetical protein